MLNPTEAHAAKKHLETLENLITEPNAPSAPFDLIEIKNFLDNLVSASEDELADEAADAAANGFHLLTSF